VERTPSDVGLQFVEVQVPVTDHSSVAAWWVPPASTAAVPAAMLYLHGNDAMTKGDEALRRAIAEIAPGCLP
jgi:hypothetical protein